MEFRKYDNEEGITRLSLSHNVTIRCPLGENYNTARVDCDIEMNDVFVNMDDLREYFANELNGGEYTQESLAAEVHETLKREYNSPHVSVRVVNNDPPATVVFKED
jgi:hypothetical protein